MTERLSLTGIDIKIFIRDFPGGPVVESLLPLQGTWVQSLVREIRSCML